MKRVLPDNNPTLDYELWKSIAGPPIQYQAVRKEERNWLSSIDRGSSQNSDLWMKEGRNRSKNDTTKIFDFISLSNSFDSWFDELKFNKPDLKVRIEQKISVIPGAKFYFEGEEDTLLEINWIILGRVIGAAVSNIGAAEKWWYNKGHDAHIGHWFWTELKREVVGSGYDATSHAEDSTVFATGIEENDWMKTGDWFRQQTDFDPESEALRSVGHRASSPFWKENHRPSRYYANPFSLIHQKSFSREFHKSIGEEELKETHGRITLQLLGEALRSLRGINPDRFANFAITIHGMCAFHIVRTDQIQQKIGLHLFSNLVARKMSRDVGGSNVPDIAKHLKTGFSLAKVLKILSDKNHKIIQWNTVEKEIVDNIVNGL
jgi:hypothetical protein